MPWEMKKLHHWYMQAAKEGVSMIPVKYGPDIFNDMEPDKVNYMGITFDKIYCAYRLQRLYSTLITLWCMLCSIYQRKTHLHTREFWKLAYLNPQLLNQTAINPRLNPNDPKYTDKTAAELQTMQKELSYKQPKGSMHCGYYTCIFSQSSSKYLDCIVEESKEEKEKRMKKQRTQKQKEYEMIRRGIIPPDSLHLSTNVMYRVVANLCRFILREIIHPLGKFFDPESDLGMNHYNLCDWAGSTRPYEPNLPPMEYDDYKVLEKEPNHR
ncbi:hypothetical protein EJB05_27391, partial [Eragrostis curvula]